MTSTRSINQYMSLWTEDVLRQLSLEEDPFGNSVADSIFEFMGDGDPKQWRQYMVNLAKQDFFTDPDKSGLVALNPPTYARYFNISYPKSDDTSADAEAYRLSEDQKGVLNRASLFFEKNGPAILMCLAVRSLLKQYSSGNTSELLGRTKLLTEHADRRIIETMQFVIDVMKPDWFEEKPSWIGHGDQTGSPSLQSVKKLRLTHSMIRSRVKAGQLGDWNKDELDAPINQEDMIMANLTFSLEVIEGLRQLGIEVSEQEQNDFFEAWLIIGDMLGIAYPQGLKPRTYEEAWALQNKLYERNFTCNDYGPKLADALLVWLNETIPMMDKATTMDVIREINGDENIDVLVDYLELDFNGPQPGSSNPITRMIKKLKAKSKTANRTYFQELFNALVNELLGTKRGGERRPFSILDGFAESWELTPNQNDRSVTRGQILWRMIKAIASVTGHRILYRLQGKKHVPSHESS